MTHSHIFPFLILILMNLFFIYGFVAGGPQFITFLFSKMARYPKQLDHAAVGITLEYRPAVVTCVSMKPVLKVKLKFETGFKSQAQICA